MPGFEGPSMVDFSSLTSTAVLGWYAWYTAYFVIPGIVQAFRDELAAVRSECAAECEALHTELAAERDQRYAHHALVVESLRDLARRLPSDHPSR
jgi:hypothetical protein